MSSKKSTTKQEASNVIQLNLPELLGEAFQDFIHIDNDWRTVPKTAAKKCPKYKVWISNTSWDLVLPGVKNELEVFGKTKAILEHLVSFGGNIADILKPGWEVSIFAGYLDGEQLFLRCMRVKEGFYLDL